MEEQRQQNKELWPWSWTWRRPSSESASCGLGDALELHKKDLAGALWVFRAPVYSSKDVRQSRLRPSRLYCQGPSGVVLHDALSKVTEKQLLRT